MEGQARAWMESYVKNEERGWDADQVWGFAVVEGKRYYTRRIIATKGAGKGYDSPWFMISRNGLMTNKIWLMSNKREQGLDRLDLVELGYKSSEF